jgi:hypothetical protein
MSPRGKTQLVIGVAAAMAVAALWYLLRVREPAKPHVAPVVSTVSPTPRVEAAPLPSQPPEPAPPATAPTQAITETAEMRATNRMIMAHASLRAPAEANPDSKENREILQTMLSKALTRKETPPPQPPAAVTTGKP